MNEASVGCVRMSSGSVPAAFSDAGPKFAESSPDLSLSAKTAGFFEYFAMTFAYASIVGV